MSSQLWVGIGIGGLVMLCCHRKQLCVLGETTRWYRWFQNRKLRARVPIIHPFVQKIAQMLVESVVMRPDVRTIWRKAGDRESIGNIYLDEELLCLQSPNIYHRTATGFRYNYAHQSMPDKCLLVTTRQDEVRTLEEDKAWVLRSQVRRHRAMREAGPDLVVTSLPGVTKYVVLVSHACNIRDRCSPSAL